MFGKLTLRRQMVLCVLILAVNLVLAYLFENAYAQIYPESSEYENYAGIYLFCFIATLLTTTNNVVHYCQLILEQREQLVKLRKQMFKNKLDPHFVFNSLSVLTELIHQEPTKAEKYSIQFSRLYRHLLADIDRDYISVNESLEFVQEYVKLQQYRMDGKIELNVNSFAINTDEYLFPLALQTLVENAIKHNEPAKGEVLRIAIERDGNKLVVTNNVIGNTNPTPLFGIGLQTLYQQYKMEKLPEPHIKYNMELFEVRMLIFKKKIHA